MLGLCLADHNSPVPTPSPDLSVSPGSTAALVVLEVVVWGVVGLLYLLPTAVAWQRKTSNMGAVVII
jgi:hypothetical protein